MMQHKIEENCCLKFSSYHRSALLHANRRYAILKITFSLALVDHGDFFQEKKNIHKWMQSTMCPVVRAKMNAWALWGDRVGVGAQDIYVNYNVDGEEKKALRTLEHCPCFLDILWCGFDGTAEGLNFCGKPWKRGLSPDLTPYTSRRPCGTPLAPLK